jgi:hypothetical protein
MKYKRFRGLMVFNTKSGAMRIVKKDVQDHSPHDVFVRFDIEVDAPLPQIPLIEHKIVVPKQQIREMVLDNI